MPPLSFFLKPMLGGFLLSRIPNPSISCSIIFLCCKGFSTSRTIKMMLQVRATVRRKKNAQNVKVKPGYRPLCITKKVSSRLNI